MGKHDEQPLSRRERQIMDAVYRMGKASVGDIRSALHDPPSYSTVRALVNILENKGHLKHSQTGNKYIYSPTQPRQRIGRSMLRRVVDTFYSGSVEKVIAALLRDGEAQLSEEELQRIQSLIEEARKEGR